MKNNAATPTEFDISQVTPEQAGRMLNDRAEQVERNGRGSYEQCFASAKLLRPDLVARMSEANNTSKAAAANVALSNDLPSEPVANPQNKMLLGLPADATSDEFSTAWKATRGFTSPRNSLAIFSALVSLMMGKDVNRTTATSRARERYPLLDRELYPSQSNS
jgi:hypothetical protein